MSRSGTTLRHMHAANFPAQPVGTVSTVSTAAAAATGLGMHHHSYPIGHEQTNKR